MSERMTLVVSPVSRSISSMRNGRDSDTPGEHEVAHLGGVSVDEDLQQRGVLAADAARLQLADHQVLEVLQHLVLGLSDELHDEDEVLRRARHDGLGQRRSGLGAFAAPVVHLRHHGPPRAPAKPGLDARQ